MLRGTVALQRPPLAFVLLDTPSTIQSGAQLSVRTRGVAHVRPPTRAPGAPPPVIDYLGRPLDQPLGDDASGDVGSSGVKIIRDGPVASELKPIDTSLHTGTAALDALAPLGRGQSMLILGPNDATTAIARGAVGTQRALSGTPSDARAARGAQCYYAHLTGAGGAEAAADAIAAADGALDGCEAVVACRAGDADGADAECEAVLAAAAALALAEVRAVLSRIAERRMIRSVRPRSVSFSASHTPCRDRQIERDGAGKDTLVVLNNLHRYHALWHRGTDTMARVGSGEGGEVEVDVLAEDSEMRTCVQAGRRRLRARAHRSARVLVLTHACARPQLLLANVAACG